MFNARHFGSRHFNSRTLSSAPSVVTIDGIRYYGHTHISLGKYGTDMCVSINNLAIHIPEGLAVCIDEDHMDAFSDERIVKLNIGN